MNSLKYKLLLSMTGGVALALAVGMWAVFGMARSRLYRELDRGLTERVASLSAMISQEAGMLELDWLDYDEVPPGFQPGIDYFLVENRAREEIVAASAGLVGWRFLELDWSPAKAEPHDMVLPGYREGRAVMSVFDARTEAPDDEEEESEDERSGPWTEAPGNEGETLAGGNVPVKLLVARADTVAPTMAVIKRFLAGLWVVCLVLVGGIVWWVVRRNLRSINCLGEEIGKLDEQAVGRRVDVTGLPTELLPVTRQLNHLLERVEKTLVRERALTSNVAHELRTPIAGLLSILEVTLSRVRSPREYRELNVECLEIAKRMHWLVSNLLSVARIEANNVQIDRQVVDIGRALVEWWEPFSTRAKMRGLRVTWEVAPETRIHTDPEFLRIIVNNLFDNAVSYAPEGGAIRILVDAAGTISVANETIEVKQEIVEHAFDPFWRHSETREDTGAHAGLGLSLCRKIAELLGGKISAAIKESEAVFVVRVEMAG